MTLGELRSALAGISGARDGCEIYVTDCRNGVSDRLQSIMCNQYLANRGNWDGEITDELSHGDLFVEMTIG